MFLLKDLISKVREFGIAVVSADQIPSELPSYVASNAGTIVLFRLSNGTDLESMRRSAGFTPEQAAENYTLQPGQALVRSARCSDVHRIVVPYRNVEKFVGREELDLLMRPLLDELHADVVAWKPSEPTATPLVDLTDAERGVLQALAEDCLRPCSEVYRAAGLSLSAGHRVKQLLLRRGCVVEFVTNLGKNGKRAVVLVPNLETLSEFGMQLRKGMGTSLHRFTQEVLRRVAEQLGCIAVIEDRVAGTSEAPDVGATKGNVRVALESAVTSRPAQEVEHVAKALRLGFTHVLLCFLTRAALAETRRLAAQRYSRDILKKVSFCLINEVADALKEVLL